jgi:hypothetical protein
VTVIGISTGFFQEDHQLYSWMTFWGTDGNLLRDRLLGTERNKEEWSQREMGT